MAEPGIIYAGFCSCGWEGDYDYDMVLKKTSFTARHNCATFMSQEVNWTMPMILPIRDLRNTSEISDLAHKRQEPIYITKNGYSDLVVMSAELFDKFARVNKIDQAIDDAEREVAEGATPISAKIARKKLDEKYYGQV